MENVRRILYNRKLAIRICLILMFLGGVMISFMVPPWQTPDEYTHLDFIGRGIGNEKLAEELLQDLSLDDNRLRFSYEDKVDISQWKEAMTLPPGYDRAACLPKGVRLSVLWHLPATIGVTIGVLFHLPTFWVLTLGELFALIFYIAVSGAAVSLMPMKQEALLLVMAFPMALQQGASLNYDAVLLPLCFLYVAAIFHMRYKKERLGWPEAIGTLVLLLWITYIKMPYVLLGLLVFWLPAEKIHLQIGKFVIDGEFLRKWRWPLIGLLLLCMAGGIFLLRGNYFLQLLGGMLLEFPRTGYLVAFSAFIWKKYLLISSVGQFGWLESQLPFGFVILTYCFLAVMAVWGKKESLPGKWNWKSRLWLWVVCGTLCCITIMSMVNHTIMITFYGSETADTTYNIREALYQIGSIGGLQGRYFLPFLVLPFLALPEKGKEWKGKPWLAACYMVAAMALTASVLYQRYWIG